MSKCIYTPAIGEQFNSVWKRGLKYKGKDGKEYDMKFWNKESHFDYGYALQSVYYVIEGVGKGCDLKDNTYRKLIGYPKEKLMIFDSAGFQLASFKRRGEECNIKPIDSLRWQEANCDIGMNLDIPPNLDGKQTLKEFNDALDDSVENFELFEKERVNYDMKLYNVLHGETIPLMDIWYNRVKDFKFDGWAVGMKPPFDPTIQALAWAYLHSKGEFDKESFYGLHFFGTSGKHVCPLLVYCADKMDNSIVTYDSSSYNIGSIFRTYFMPFEQGPSLSFGDKFKNNPEIKELPCKCPVCESIGDIQELNQTDIYAGTLISLHNMYQYIYYNNILNSLVKNKSMFLDYLKKINTNEKTFKAIEFIDYYLEVNNLEKAFERYKDIFPNDMFQATKQGGLFDF